MEKFQKAVALKYNKAADQAPKVTAKGKGPVAEKIIAVAKESQVPLVEDQNLIEVLEALDLDMEIPPELYRAVAEVLAFVYRLNGKV